MKSDLCIVSICGVLFSPVPLTIVLIRDGVRLTLNTLVGPPVSLSFSRSRDTTVKVVRISSMVKEKELYRG